MILIMRNFVEKIRLKLQQRKRTAQIKAEQKNESAIQDTASVNRDQLDSSSYQETQQCDTFRKIDV